MKKILTITLIVVLAGVFVGLRYFVNTKDSIKINATDEGNYVDVTLEKGDYKVGDIVYLLYDETNTVSYFFENVMALDNEDIIAVYELTSDDVDTLADSDLDVTMEVLISEDEIEEVGLDKIQRSIKLKKATKTETKEQLEIKNQFEEKQQNFEEQENANQSDNSNSTDTESGSNKTETTGESNESDNSNNDDTTTGSNQSDNANSEPNSNQE